MPPGSYSIVVREHVDPGQNTVASPDAMPERPTASPTFPVTSMMSQNPFADRENVSVNTMGNLVYYISISYTMIPRAPVPAGRSVRRRPDEGRNMRPAGGGAGAGGLHARGEAGK